MANDSNLWFELGVRDQVSSALDKLLVQANELQRAFDAASKEIEEGFSFKDAYKNAAELEQAIDKISQAISRVNDAQSRATGSSQTDLAKVKDKLEEMLSVFEKIKEQMFSKENGFQFFGKDVVAVAELMEGMKLAVTQAERYAKVAEKITSENDKMFEKALNDLNAFNEAWEKMNSGESRQAQLVREMKEEEEAAYNAYRAYKEEQAAYDDFIASLDMADD